MTFAELNSSARSAAKTAWYEARKAYYAAGKAAGELRRTLTREIPKSLKSLQSFTAESAKGHKYLADNAAKAKANIRKLTE